VTADLDAGDPLGPVLLIGAGRMGGALLDGWRATGAFPFGQLLIRAPKPNAATGAATAAGAIFNPADDELPRARTVLLGVKPQKWREVAQAYAPLVSPDAVIVSVAVGVRAADVSAAFGGRRAVRVMPTTGVAIARGVATVFAPDAAARARAHLLFDPIAVTVDLADENLMDAAAATSGSAPAYLYAFTEALAEAGAEAGLPREAALRLARATIGSAAALMEASDEPLESLRKQVASPGGTTEAALKVLMGEGGLEPLLREALAAAIARAHELARTT
jgi:pyrroline-5-carboxylate reductase